MTGAVPAELWRDHTLVDHAAALTRTYLSGDPQRAAHVEAVAELAERVARRLAPTALYPIVAAAHLHDIGYAPNLQHTGFHPLDGANFARAEGFPELVVGLIAHHTGAWSEALERGLSEELAQFRLPPKPLLDILTYADLHCGPCGDSVPARERLAEVLDRYGPAEPVHRAVRRSRRSLLAATGRVEAALAAAGSGRISTQFNNLTQGYKQRKDKDR